MKIYRTNVAGVLGLLLVLLMVTACSQRIYGVPEEQWEMMTPMERQTAMKSWQAVELARAEQRAREAELAAERERLEQARRDERIAAIRAGHGLIGDLLRVSLQGGQVRLGGSHRDLQPLSFTIASGEVRELQVEAGRGSRIYRGTLRVSYDDGLLMLDIPSYGTAGAARLAYGAGWQHGVRSVVSSNGPLRLRDVVVYVEAVPLPNRRYR